MKIHLTRGSEKSLKRQFNKYVSVHFLLQKADFITRVKLHIFSHWGFFPTISTELNVFF